MAKKILVIDDDPNIVELIRRRLEASQFQVVTACNGQEGFDKLAPEKPDLVIVDVLMPQMDGYTFVRNVRKEEDFKNLPIIVLTAKDKMKDLFELEGVREYIVKPYRPEDLMQKVKRNLGVE